MVLMGSTGVLTSAYAEPSVAIIMEKTTYTYCEKLVYSIEVSEITGDPELFTSEMVQVGQVVPYQFQ